MARQNTSKKTKTLVWIRAAGHCELCGKDLTTELVSLKAIYDGEVAHVYPASAGGPRGRSDYTEADATRLTDDPENLLLLCPNCHTAIDKTPDETYPAQDLTDRHQGYLERVRVAAKTPHTDFGAGVIVLGHHFQTKNRIEPTELQQAMWCAGIRPHRIPLVIELPEIINGERDETYYRNVRYKLKDKIHNELSAARSDSGDTAIISLAALADIPSLVILGQEVGDRCRRVGFSVDRDTRLRWPDPGAVAPVFQFYPPALGDADAPVALVLCISAEIPHADVHAALPEARIAVFRSPTPSIAHIRNAGFIGAFRNQLQARLSELEACTARPIHVFAAIPAAYAVEFGALLSMHHQHGYVIYDRTGGTNSFAPHVSTHLPQEELAA